MNPATIKMLLNAFTTLRSRLKEYNEQKTRETYDLLSDAAERIDLEELRARGESLIDEGRKEAGQVTQAAHLRLEAAKQRLAEVAANAPAKERAREAKNRRTWTLVGLAALLVSAIGGAVYWFTREKSSPGDIPPHVEDFSGTDNTSSTADTAADAELVYSTETPGSPEEGVAERDEELLSALEEQLGKHRVVAEGEEKGEEEGEEEPDGAFEPVESVDDITDPDAEAGDKK